MTLRLFELLPIHPIVTAASVMARLNTSRPTAGKAISVLAEAGILREATGRKRDRVFHYARYLDRLREGTDSLGPNDHGGLLNRATGKP